MLVEHHTKYIEIDGIDETVWVTKSEHAEIHKTWHVPVDITDAAHRRTLKYKAADRARARKYRKQNIRGIHFRETLYPKIQLHDTLRHNIKTGTVVWNSCFVGTHGTKLYDAHPE